MDSTSGIKSPIFSQPGNTDILYSSNDRCYENLDWNTAQNMLLRSGISLGFRSEPMYRLRACCHQALVLSTMKVCHVSQRYPQSPLRSLLTPRYSGSEQHESAEMARQDGEITLAEQCVRRANSFVQDLPSPPEAVLLEWLGYILMGMSVGGGRRVQCIPY
jgi:hypothetical protein